MSFRSFFSRSALVFGLLAALAFSPDSWSDSTPKVDPDRTLRFNYHVEVTDLPVDAESVKVWIPLPQSTEHQQVSHINVNCTGAQRIVTDDKYGNQFMLLELNPSESLIIEASYRVTRLTRRDLSGIRSASAKDVPEAGAFLASSRLIALGGPVEQEARRVAGDAKDPLEIAKRLYDHIVATMEYDKTGEGWGRGDSLYACDARTGNCTDFHSLFVAEARALGVPARFIMGFPIPAGLNEAVIPGYHCWAEFYTREQGWVAIDASEAFKHPENKEFLFGNLDPNRIQFTKGRDIEIPGMAGEPVNYSIYPYVEVDGKIHTAINTEYFFTDIDSNDGSSVAD